MAKKFQFDGARAKALFNDVNVRANAAREQVATRREVLAQFNKDNAVALIAAGKIVVGGAKPLANDAVVNTRKQLGAVVANVKELKELKGKRPAELVKVQGEFAKAQLVVARDDAKAFGQSCVKLAGTAVEPLKTRFAAVREQRAAA